MSGFSRVGIAVGTDEARPETGPMWAKFLEQVGSAAGNVAASLEIAREWRGVPLPASGKTAIRWEFLASAAAVDLTAARVLEPHLDAVAILAEAAAVDPLHSVGSQNPILADGQTWGVFASEGPASTVAATLSGGQWQLTGVKPWCSIAGDLSRALITADTSEGTALFAIDLKHPGVQVRNVDWISRGLSAVPSGPIELTTVPGVMIGSPGWYLQRPGFWWGGIGVAACWYGGAVGLARTAWAATRERPVPSALIYLGRVDIALHQARAALAEAARLADGPGHASSTGADTAADPSRLAMRVRAVVAATAETTLREVGQLLGPGPLAFDEPHARRVADLTVYVRQHHADRDLAGLGEGLVKSAEAPW
ncbi:MAG: acyl-CoA dehydrogenase [Pseudonocardiales bacterium]|nr:acyl-CoA dehydrogenase [Pseudonocardiales bacterium]